MSKDFFERYSDKLTYRVDSLANCESEPIRVLGAIQDRGYFIAAHVDDLEIIAVSENLPAFLGVDLSSVLGQKLDRLIEIPELQPLTKESLTVGVSANSLRGSFVQRKDAGAFTVSMHVSSQHFCIDIEPITESTNEEKLGLIKTLIERLADHDDYVSLASAACTQLRAITGYDRVMVYRFLENHDGEVIGEDHAAGLDPYLHLRYPASDIPAQARALYLESRYRMIGDSQAEPIPVQTIQGIARRELNLSCSGLRATSPIHIKYLQNMGVRASFSVPIRLNGKLWGLFACHRYDRPHWPSIEVRNAAELSSQIFSSRLLDFISKRRLKAKNNTLLLNQDLLNSIATGKSPIEAFKANEKEVLALTRATGAYVRMGGLTARLGICPREDLLDALMSDLAKRESQTSWKTQCLSFDYPALEPDPNVAGALAIPLSLGFEDSIVWFRPEEYQEIKWGGKPPERTAMGELKTTLEPRASFKAYAESIANHSQPWTEEDEDAAQFLLFSFIQGIFAKAAQLSRAYEELERVAKAKDEFIGLVSHELRTPLGVILGWVDIMKDIPSESEEMSEAIGVVERNARLQIALINDLLDISRIISGKLRIDPQANLNMSRLINEVVEGLLPTARAKSIAIRWNRPADILVTGDSDRLRQVVYNLMNNAIKFTPKGGTVTVSIEKRRSSYQVVVEDNGVGIHPSEINGIFDRFVQVGAQKAQHQGLGLGLSIVKVIAELHGGRVYAESAGLGKGTRFTLSLPVYALAPQAEEEHTSVEAPKANSTELADLLILIAEDQPDSALALQATIKRFGGKTLVAPDGAEALKILTNTKVDLILSDIGMPEMNGYELMTAWRKLEEDRRTPPIPAIALTAYARPKDRASALEAGFQNHIAKPVDRAELLAVIRAVRKMMGK